MHVDEGCSNEEAGESELSSYMGNLGRRGKSVQTGNLFEHVKAWGEVG